jgi:hypothetical protein
VKEKLIGNATEKTARGTNREGMGTSIKLTNGAKYNQRTAAICTGEIIIRDTSNGMGLLSGKALDSYS